MAAAIGDYIVSCYSSLFNNLNYSGFSYSNAYTPRKPINNGAFTKYMKIDLSGKILELPCVYKYIIAETLEYNNSHLQDAADAIYVPLYYMEEDPREAKSSNTILKKFFYNFRNSHNLVKVRSTNGVYLGGEGLILYDDYSPLIMYSLQVERVLDPENPSKYKYVPLKTILRVSPNIYYKDDLLAKYIRSKLILNSLELNRNINNYICSGRSLVNNRQIFTQTRLDYDFRVIIEDFSSIFELPKIPDTNFSNDKINDLLNSNLDSILADIKQ